MSILAFDIGGTSVKSAIANFSDSSSVPVFTCQSKDEPSKKDFQSLKNVIIQTVRKCEPVRAIGISTTGTVSINQIVLRSGFFKGYESISWVEQLKTAGINCPVVVMNDGHAAATAENAPLIDVDKKNTTHFVIGTGIGGGAFVDGHLLLGTAGYAGAFGHIKVHPGGGLPTCGCTRKGCVETLAAAPAIQRLLSELSVDTPKADDTMRMSLLSSGSRFANDNQTYSIAEFQRAFSISGKWLGRAIGSVINVLNPSVVTVGGGVVEADHELAAKLSVGIGPYLEAAFSEAINSSLTRSAEAVQLRPSRYGNEGGLIGASIAAYSRIK